MTRRSTLLPLLWLSLLLSDGADASYSPVHLRRCVEEAWVIVAGTVHSITPRDLEGAIVSEVELRDLEFLRCDGSSRSGRLLLEVCGGQLADRGMGCPESPQFQVGERHILLLKSLGTRRDSYTPVVFLNQGMFPVVADPADTAGTVRDWLGRPIVAVHEGRIVSLSRLAGHMSAPGSGRLTHSQVIEIAMRTHPNVAVVEIPWEHDPRTRFTEAMFLQEIRSLMGERSREPSKN